MQKKTIYYNPNTKLTDSYFWLQDPKNIETLDYIKEENSYTENFMLPLKQLERNLFSEFLGRQRVDTTEFYGKKTEGGYEYYFKTSLTGDDENIYRKKTGSNNEELVLDVGKKAENHPNYWVDIETISPDNKIFAYTEPITDGYDSRTVFYNMETGRNVDSLDKAACIIWEKNSKSFLYLKWDETNWPHAVYKHKLGTNQKKDQLIYIEKDKSNNVALLLRDKKHIILEARNDFYDNKAYLLKGNEKGSHLLKITDQKRGFAHYFIVKNDTIYSLSKEPNGKTVLYSSSINKPEKESWKKIIENTGSEFFSQFKVLKDYIIILEQENMKTRIRIINKSGETVKLISFNKEESYTVEFLQKDSSRGNVFRYSYTSLATPSEVFEYSIDEKKTESLRHSAPIGFDKKKYKTKLIRATSQDGEKIPISIVYNKKVVRQNGKSPLLLHAYGSYGSPTEPKFSSIILSLLDRGIVYAIAHVRGGGELGQMWHENAMQLKKKNTFYDYIACAEKLIKEKYTSEGKIIARGGSAGGLTVGAVANMRPELFNTVIIEAGMLDVLANLSDTTAKFCYLERVQLGDPTKEKFHDYIKSYSPYQNIKEQDYPNLFFSVGLLDSRVAYWHSVKSVAKLRALKTDKNTLLLKTDLYAGHNGYVGKQSFESFEAFIYAFILNNLKINY